jgi:hypothetical protein
MKRREYSVSIVVNQIRITKVIIDPHYEAKHAASISDELILKLVKTSMVRLSIRTMSCRRIRISKPTESN